MPLYKWWWWRLTELMNINFLMWSNTERTLAQTVVVPSSCTFAPSPGPPVLFSNPRESENLPLIYDSSFDLPRGYIAIRGRVSWNPECLRCFFFCDFFLGIKMFRLKQKQPSKDFCCLRWGKFVVILRKFCLPILRNASKFQMGFIYLSFIGKSLW